MHVKNCIKNSISDNLDFNTKYNKNIEMLTKSMPTVAYATIDFVQKSYIHLLE